MPDLDIEIKGGGGGGGWEQSSRPLDNEGGGGGLPKKFFQPFGTQFGLKIRMGGGRVPWAPPLDSPLNSTIQGPRKPCCINSFTPGGSMVGLAILRSGF